MTGCRMSNKLAIVLKRFDEVHFVRLTSWHAHLPPEILSVLLSDILMQKVPRIILAEKKVFSSTVDKLTKLELQSDSFSL